MELNITNDIIFDNIVEQIKTKNNFRYVCDIIEEEINGNIKFIKLKIGEMESNNFILYINNEDLIGQKIYFFVNSLKIKIINNIPYFLIIKYGKINIKNNESKFPPLLSNLKSNQYNIITSTKNIDNNKLYTLILKAKEIKVKTQQYKIQLEDVNKKSVYVNGTNNYDFENGKIYYFHGYIYNSLLSQFEPTNISYIENFSPKTLKIYNIQEIVESKTQNLFNFKGKVKLISLMNCSIMIECDDKKNYKINMNANLLKQITLNNECRFYNFKFINNEFFLSNLSIIEYDEQTFIEFNFPEYNTEERYFNKIRINNKYYDINKEKIMISVEDKDKNNLFLQEILYEKIIDAKIIDSYKFNLELNKGKIYHLESSTCKNCFSYEFFIQSMNEKDLPNFLEVEFNNKSDYKLKNPDKNENKLKERFTIINFPKQDIYKIYGLTKENYKNYDKDNLKYLLMIDNNKKKTLQILEKTPSQNEKKLFFISEETENILIEVSNQCYINFNENYSDQLYNIKKDDIDICKNCEDEICKGFSNIKFENSKRHYTIIKNIVSFSLNYYASIFLGKYYTFRKNYEILLDSMINLEYIDRIKILITFLLKIINSIGNKKVEYNMFNLIDIDNKSSYENFPFVKDAFDLFYQIIDELNEESALFQAIAQFNSLIYKDLKSEENFHSGTILNLNDIKLELAKNINRFIFLSELSSENCYKNADFEPKGLLVTLYIYSFSEDELFSVFDENNNDKLKSIVLFLLFHECLGHQKKNINNQKVLTPRSHYKNNFQKFSNIIADTGTALEIIFLDKIINLRYLMNSNNSKKLLNSSLYNGKDFNTLKKIYSLIEKDNDTKIDEDKKDNDKSNNNSNNSSNNNKSSNFNNVKIIKKQPRLMYRDLFILYSEVDEEKKEELKNDENYQRFLMLYKKRHESPSVHLKKINIIAEKRSNKK